MQANPNGETVSSNQEEGKYVFVGLNNALHFDAFA